MTSSLIETVILFLFTENKMEGNNEFYQSYQRRIPGDSGTRPGNQDTFGSAFISELSGDDQIQTGTQIISQRAARKTGIEIHPGATIGKGLFIDHGSGVIIGETTIIGDNVTLYQGVTLGGNGKETGKRHPTLEDNVMVSAGAKIIGSFTVGANSKIGAGSVVIEEVPPNCTVVGIPGRVVRQKNMKVPRTSMDHCHLPDPVLDDLKTLQKEYTEVTNRLLEVEKELRFIKNKKGE